MNDGSLQFTLRQLRQRFADPVTLTVLAGLSLMLGVSGPFDTFTVLPLPARLAYWAAVVPLTYAAGLTGSALVRPRLTRAAPWLRTFAAGLGSAVLVSVTLAALNGALGFLDPDPTTLLEGVAAITLICLAIEGLGHVITARAPSIPPTPSTTPQDPALLRRLPLDKRGPLISLTVQDHYVEVTTTQGRALLLMRLGDAIAECAPVAGLQTHRSHWVALSQVARARRDGDAAILTLRNGAEVPVSRSRLKSAVAAGLLPGPARD